MTENQQKVIGQTLMQFSADAAVTEEALINCVNVFSMVSPLTDAEKEGVIRELQSRLAVRIDREPVSGKRTTLLGTMRRRHRLRPLSGIAIACIFRKNRGGMPSFWTNWIAPRMRLWIFWEIPGRRKASSAEGFV